MQLEKQKKPNARKLLLKLLGSRDNIQMNASAAVRVGALFGISENNIRKLKLLYIKGFGGISVFKKKPALKKAGFYKF